MLCRGSAPPEGGVGLSVQGTLGGVDVREAARIVSQLRGDVTLCRVDNEVAFDVCRRRVD
jgi:hypothetical protein